jgi:hypothetical protein
LGTAVIGLQDQSGCSLVRETGRGGKHLVLLAEWSVDLKESIEGGLVVRRQEEGLSEVRVKVEDGKVLV